MTPPRVGFLGSIFKTVGSCRLTRPPAVRLSGAHAAAFALNRPVRQRQHPFQTHPAHSIHIVLKLNQLYGTPTCSLGGVCLLKTIVCFMNIYIHTTEHAASNNVQQRFFGRRCSWGGGWATCLQRPSASCWPGRLISTTRSGGSSRTA